MQQISIYLQYFLLIIYRLFKYLLQLILLILNPLLILFLNLFGLLPVFKNKCDSIIDTKIAECQNDLDDYLKEKGIKKRYTIKWDRSGKNKIPNANAAFHKRIILTGDWSFLKVDEKEITDWKTVELEILRDKNGNCLCSNFELFLL